MLRTVVRLSPNAILPLFGTKNEYDYDTLNQPSTRKPETGWDRVKAMYSKNEYDEVSVEVHTVIQSSLCGAFIGACFGGFLKSRESYVYFLENNQATIFRSTVDAKKKLQDYMMIAFAKGAYKWGWKLGLFTGMFSLIATTVSVYRDDTTLVEYISAGAITGGLYKCHLGLPATFVGAALGATLSTFAGLAILGLLKVSGFSMAEIRQALYRIKEAREDQLNQALDKAAKIRHDDLTRHHDQLVVEKAQQNIEHID